MAKLKRETLATNGHKDGVSYLTLSDGFVLPYLPVAPGMANRISQARTEPPKPPIQVVETVAGVQEYENKDHPDYIRAVRIWQNREAYRKAFALVKHGGRLVLNDEQNAIMDEYVSDLQDLGDDSDWTPRNRMAAYVIDYHARTAEDYATLIGCLSGNPTRSEVDAAKTTFRGDAEGA